MIRRPATRIPDLALGFVIEQVIKTDVEGNQTLKFIFEAAGPGTVSEEPMADIHFTDGSPIKLPTH